jgi:hypothetical protein
MHVLDRDSSVLVKDPCFERADKRWLTEMAPMVDRDHDRRSAPS